VTNHVLGNEHGQVLAAVVHGDRQTDHLGKNDGAARPGLDRAAVVLLGSRLDLLGQVVVHEGTLLE